MSGIVTPFVDFSANTNNDSGENNASSIQPVTDGERVIGAVQSRPDESLRQRTEAIRARQVDSIYLENADRGLVMFGPIGAGVTWPGSTTAGQTGIPVLTNGIWLLPMLTPGASGNSPPVASSFGVIHLKRSSDGTNAILVTSNRRSYAAGDQISITVAAGTPFSCAVDAEVGLRRTIKIVATPTTTLSTVISALNAIFPPSPDPITQLVVAALEGGALGSDFILSPQSKQFMSGNYDGEAHVIGVGTLASFFASNPTQALAEGDTLCVEYAMLFDTASNGGRRQSIPENTNTSIPAGSFFNSRVHPEKLVNALPICKVLNNTLVFATGCEIKAGSVGATLGGRSGTDLSYGGGNPWADGTTNPATTVEGQLDKIITDLAGTHGSAKIQAAAIGTDEAASTVETQTTSILTGLLDLARREMITDTMLGGICIGAPGSFSDPDDPSQVGAGLIPLVPFTPSSNHVYTLRPGSARFAPGSAGNKLSIQQGTLLQARPEIRADPGLPPIFIPTVFDGTDEFTFANGHATLPRVDLLQMKLAPGVSATAGYPNKRVVTRIINIKQGTPATPPVMPEPDANFVPLCYVYVNPLWDGTTPIGRPWYNSGVQANVFDVRMPVNVQGFNVKVSKAGLYDPAVWVPQNNGRTLKCNTSTDSTNNRLNVQCPAIRGRLVGISTCSGGAPSGTLNNFMGTMEEPAGHGEVYDMSTAFTTATSPTLTLKFNGLETIDFNAKALAGFVTHASNWGLPLWCNGFQMHDAPFKDRFVGFGGTAPNFNFINITIKPFLNFEISDIAFFVAVGL